MAHPCISQGKFLPIGQVAIVIAKNAKVVGCRKIYGKQSDKLVRQIPIRRSVAILFSVALRCNFATGCSPYQNMRYNSEKPRGTLMGAPWLFVAARESTPRNCRFAVVQTAEGRALTDYTLPCKKQIVIAIRFPTWYISDKVGGLIRMPSSFDALHNL